MTALIESTDHGQIRELRLARAPVNALNPELCTALADAVARAVSDGVGGLVLAGGPKVFSAGLDVPYLLSLQDKVALKAAWESFFTAARSLTESPIPVVAAIAGHAPAGGCVLALCCDYRVMANSPSPDRPFQIGLNETRVGLAAPEGIQQLMRRVVGTYRAERLLVAGEMVSAERALALGLVDELAEIEQVPLRARAWLEQLLQLPRSPMLQTRAFARADLIEALKPERIHLDMFIDAWSDPDTQAGLRALVAKLGK
ncbi:enoyl-CoA hydratase/isomerase family protein [Luteimonas panaciterrae]|uniref:enoyl-CoA hydratase/isomerase family protein n=1 Tax=Luteimonas panaciterrae TaxID=363885 RepID=UPI001CFA8F64|nr:enoyl-CoA hydratase/isomerase family protein [Luteimonas panaciterrae]